MGKKKPSRARSERRAVDREVKKQLEARERVGRLSPGGAPERPIEVATASLVEPMARASRCVRCDAEVRLEEHAVRSVEGRSLRVARVSCPSCGATREIYFAIVTPVLH